MAELKTKPTEVNVTEFLNAIKDETRRADCRTLVKMMTKVTKAKPKMWGPTIVGFGTYHYKYASGHEGDCCVIGFASRKPDLTIYILTGFPNYDALMSKLGKHKMGKCCLYIRNLSDIDMAVLEKIVKGSVAHVARVYPKKSAGR
ncbi:MAG: DUF1801 domain-containing protein [bacterium]